MNVTTVLGRLAAAQDRLLMSPRKNRLLACNVAASVPLARVLTKGHGGFASDQAHETMSDGQRAVLKVGLAFAKGEAVRDDLTAAADAAYRQGRTDWLGGLGGLCVQPRRVHRRVWLAIAEAVAYQAPAGARNATSAALQANLSSVMHANEELEAVLGRGLSGVQHKVRAVRDAAFDLALRLIDDVAMPDVTAWQKKDLGKDVRNVAGSVLEGATPPNLLADALEDSAAARCRVGDHAVAHLRAPGRHFTGCWAVDWAMGVN